MMYPMALVALLCAMVGYFVGVNPRVEDLRQLHERAPGEALAGIEEADEADLDRAEASNEREGEPTIQDFRESVGELLRAYQIDRIAGFVFLVVFGICMFALCVDTEVRWALIGFVTVGLLVTTLILLNQVYGFLPGLLQGLLRMTPNASPQFYLGIFYIWLALMVISLITIRFHYVRIEANEVLVVGGLLEAQKRYPTMHMKYEKDISDVIEYYTPFVNSGRLVLVFPMQNEKLVIDHVIQIDKVIARLNKLSSSLEVDVTRRQMG